MTDLAENAEHTTDWIRFEQRTTNLAAHRLRDHEDIRSTIYGPSPAAETMILDNTGVPYRYKVPVFTPLAHGPDAWIFDITGEMQEPPTGNPPPLPPSPPGPTIPPRPAGFQPAHRRRLSPWIGLAIVLGTGLAMWAGGFLAAVAVMR